MEDYTVSCPEPHIWDTDPELQKLTVPEYLLKRAKDHAKTGDPILNIDGITGEEIPFSAFDSLTGNIAAWFSAQGLAKGDIVLFMVNRFTKLSLFQNGVWRANGVVRSIYSLDLEDSLVDCMVESKSKWIYCDAEDADKCKSAASKVPWRVTVIVNGHADNSCVPIEQLLECDGPVPALAITPQDPALILLTSGSTGRPKGAVRKHKALLKYILSGETFGLQDRLMLVTTGVHISGTGFALVAIALGITAIIGWKKDVIAIMEGIHKFKPRMVWAFPSYFLEILGNERKNEYNLSSLEYVFVGGSFISEAFEEKMKEFKNYKHTVVIYGATETVFFVGFSRAIDKHNVQVRKRTGFQVGTVMPGAQIRICEPGTEKVLGPNEKGEVCVKTADLITEYFNSPEKTSAAFTSDGFYKTGDLGSLDEDGILSIYGREKEVFKYNNYHIAPNEIDDIVAQHPAVLECCTIGTALEGGFNVVPKVFLTLRPGFSGTTPDEIATFANDKMPEYMQLRGGVHIVEALPRGDSGKVTRQLVASLLNNQINL